MLTYALEKNGSSSLYTQLYGCINNKKNKYRNNRSYPCS